MKIKRQSKIIELIENNEVETQKELANLLKKSGYNVTQATVSRDIQELNLAKVTNSDGKPCYTASKIDDMQMSDRLKRVFRDGVVSLQSAQNLLVIKTFNGMAMAVAAAIDSMNIEDIIGCIAGDDTIFCAIKSTQKAEDILRQLEIIKNER